MAQVAKIIELVGESNQSWQDAVQNAVTEASKTIRGINGIEVTNWTANVENGRLRSYKVDVKVAFGVDPVRS